MYKPGARATPGEPAFGSRSPRRVSELSTCENGASNCSRLIIFADHSCLAWFETRSFILFFLLLLQRGINSFGSTLCMPVPLAKHKETVEKEWMLDL